MPFTVFVKTAKKILRRPKQMCVVIDNYLYVPSCVDRAAARKTSSRDCGNCPPDDTRASSYAIHATKMSGRGKRVKRATAKQVRPAIDRHRGRAVSPGRPLGQFLPPAPVTRQELSTWLSSLASWEQPGEYGNGGRLESVCHLPKRERERERDRDPETIRVAVPTWLRRRMVRVPRSTSTAT